MMTSDDKAISIFIITGAVCLCFGLALIAIHENKKVDLQILNKKIELIKLSKFGIDKVK